MFKDVFVLKKNSYHVKMMKYIWNLEYHDFSHMCPYWWLSVFNHIIFLPLFCIKSFLKGIRLLANFIGSFFEAVTDYYEQKKVDNYRTLAKEIVEDPKKILKLTDRERNEVYYHINDYESLQKIKNYYWSEKNKNDRDKEIKKQKKEEIKITQSFEELVKKINDDEAANITALEDQRRYLREQERIKEEAERQRKIRNKQKITRILKIIKPALTYGAYIVGTFLVGIFLYYFVMFIRWFYTVTSEISSEKWHEMVSVFWLLFKITITTGIISIIWYFLFKFAHRMKFSMNLPFFGVSNKAIKLISFILKPFLFIFLKFIRFIKFIKNGILLIIQMIKNECPAIKWQD